MADSRPALPPVDLNPPPLADDGALVRLVTDWLSLLAAPDQIIELRALGVRNGNYRSFTSNGFFAPDRFGTLAQIALGLTGRARGVYVTLNPLRPELLARRCNRIERAEDGDCAKDADILIRRWLLIDVDPVRDSKIGATDAEKAHAGEMALAIREFLHRLGWPEPIVVDSGNGYHLLYRIDIPAADDGLVKRVLAALARQFDSEYAKVDTSVFNPSRICKLAGTLARKGDETPDRPHRRSHVLHVPAELIVADQSLLETIAGAAPATPAPGSRPARTQRAENGSNDFQHRLDVPRWLSDRGIAFRVKDQPDSLGRTTYVLAVCPFHAGHGDPDSCIMQAPSGQLSARCFHNSCGGHGWQAFKQAIGGPERHHYDPPMPERRTRRCTNGSRRERTASTPPQPGGADIAVVSDVDAPDLPDAPDAPDPSDPSDQFYDCDRSPDGPTRPEICGNHRQLRDVTADALAAILAANKPPVTFEFGGVLARLRTISPDPTPRIEPMTESMIRGLMARVADWTLERHSHGQVYCDPAPPPGDVVKDLAVLPDWPGVPRLEAVVESPVFVRDGTLILEPGYHESAGVWYAPARGFLVPPIPERPSPEEIATAKSLILDDLLGGFPFVDDASQATAVALLLLPFVRPLIDGPTPLHVFDAPQAGTGKSLVARTACVIAHGREIPVVPEAETDAEWRKRITSVLAEARPVVLLDNLGLTLDSPSLAAALTSAVWSDRVLGVTKMMQAPNRAVWIATANNPSFSIEMIRRSVWCRLDARCEHPSERTGFRHALPGWALANRGQLIGAALTLIRSWLARGRPSGCATMGGFDGWAATMSGILQSVGIEGLLANRAEFQATQQAATDDWPAFLHAWWEAHSDKPVGVIALYDLAFHQHLLDGVLGNNGTQSQRCRLGRALAGKKDCVLGEFTVRTAGRDRCKRQLYRLLQARPPIMRVEIDESIGR